MLTGIRCWLAVSIPLLVAGPPAAARAAEAPAELQGTWKLVSVEIQGKARDFTDGPPRWIIKGNKVRYGGDEIAQLTANAAAEPKIIDLEFLNPKKVYEGVYAVEKDTLQICVNNQTEGVKERPNGFSTKDRENWRLLVFERDKAEKPDPLAGMTGFLGVALRLDPERKEIIVNDVFDGSPAKKAGFRKDDVILQIADSAVTELRPAIDAVQRKKPGSELAFRIRRDGKERDLTVKLGVVPFALLVGLD
jgi:uncharacterized protein (TIGR03067 family)